MAKVHCDSCEVAVINGVACHEQGCPKSHIDPVTGDCYEAECAWCGQSFSPEERAQILCSEECAEAYWS